MHIEVSEHILRKLGELHRTSLGELRSIMKKHKIAPKQFSAALYELTRHGYALRSDSTKQAQVAMTEKGYHKLQSIEVKQLPFDEKKWDKMWRIVMYDIPENKRAKRDAVRANLQTLGFYGLRSGVWVHPAECAQLLDSIKKLHSLDDSSLISVTATNISNESTLLKYFGLSR